MHNLEEFFLMDRFLVRHAAQIPDGLRPLLVQASAPARLGIALILATLLPLAVIAWAARDRADGPGLTLALGFVIVPGFIANAVQHAATSLWIRDLAPGVVTGLILLLPYGVFVVWSAVRERWIRLSRLVVASAVGLLAMAPLILALHAIGGLVQRTLTP